LEKYLFVYANALISDLVILGTDFFWEHVISLSTTQMKKYGNHKFGFDHFGVDHVAGELRQRVVSRNLGLSLGSVAGSQLECRVENPFGASVAVVHRWYFIQSGHSEMVSGIFVYLGSSFIHIMPSTWSALGIGPLADVPLHRQSIFL
jgi:hypothetical protein